MFRKSKSEKIKIKIGLVEVLKPPDYASLILEIAAKLKKFIFWKIKIGGVHLIEGFPNATRQSTATAT